MKADNVKKISDEIYHKLKYDIIHEDEVCWDCLFTVMSAWAMASSRVLREVLDDDNDRTSFLKDVHDYCMTLKGNSKHIVN